MRIRLDQNQNRHWIIIRLDQDRNQIKIRIRLRQNLIRIRIRIRLDHNQISLELDYITIKITLELNQIRNRIDQKYIKIRLELELYQIAIIISTRLNQTGRQQIRKRFHDHDKSNGIPQKSVHAMPKRIQILYFRRQLYALLPSSTPFLSVPLLFYYPFFLHPLHFLCYDFAFFHLFIYFSFKDTKLSGL